MKRSIVQYNLLRKAVNWLHDDHAITHEFFVRRPIHIIPTESGLVIIHRHLKKLPEQNELALQLNHRLN